MYRSEVPPQCAVCHGTALSAPTRVRHSDGTTELELADVVEGQPYIQRFAVDRASVCFDCGHVMFSLSASGLRRLRQRKSTLSAIADG